MTIARALFVACLLLSTAIAPAIAADTPIPLPPEKIGLADLTKDTQRTSQDTESFDLVWWIPKEFWSAAFSQSDTDAKTKGEFDQLFGKYTVVAVLKGRMGTLGVDGYESEEALRAKLRIYDPAGKSYSPVPANQLDKKLALLIQIMRPMFKSILGEAGDNMQFFAFPSQTADKKPIANPLAEGSFRVSVGDEEYRYRLPLGSLLAPRRDPATGEAFPGDFRFNPYTGAALQTVTP